MTANTSNKLPRHTDISPLLIQDCPILPHEELRAFVERHFLKKDDYLACVCEQRGPVYFLDSGILTEKSRQFQETFRSAIDNISFYFAMKSNNHPDVARTLLMTGIGLDVSSGLELETAVGLNAQDIIFSGPGKTDPELQLAVREADRLIVLLDSFNELARLEKQAAEQNSIVRAGVRLNTNPAGLWRKFGILPDELPFFMEEAAKCRHIDLNGLQFHSSWNLTPKTQVEFIRSMGPIIEKLPPQAKKKLHFVDIGGGFWPPQGEWLQEAGTKAGIRRSALGVKPKSSKKHYRLKALPLEVFADQLGRAIKKHILASLPDCRIFCEPGRWLCNDAMHLLFSVVDKKGSNLVITDAGTNAVGWERFETDYFPVLNLSRPTLEEKQCDILGSLCTPHDVWGYNYWGEDILPGDVLMIPCQGAYTYSLRQNFIKPLPVVVTI